MDAKLFSGVLPRREPPRSYNVFEVHLRGPGRMMHAHEAVALVAFSSVVSTSSAFGPSVPLFDLLASAINGSRGSSLEYVWMLSMM